MLFCSRPYVLEEMRFHLTLTGSIHDPEERERLRAALTPLLAPVLRTPIPAPEDDSAAGLDSGAVRAGCGIIFRGRDFRDLLGFSVD